MIKQAFAGAVIAAAALGVVGVGPADAHTGNIEAGQGCAEWWVTVSLDNNTTSDRTVSVISTIPGHPGFTGQHFDTSYGEIWSASGPAPTSGTVTLTIDDGTDEEFSTSKTITPEDGCQTTTTTIPPTTSSTTSSTVPATTSTLASTSSTTTVPSAATSSTSTTVIEIGTPTSITAPPEELPHTGNNAGLGVLAGIGLLAGSAAIAYGRKGRTGRAVAQ